MSIRIQSPACELSALVALCTAKTSLSVRLMGRLRDEHFNHLPAQQAWRRIKAISRSKGRVPSWEDVVEDTSIDRDCRRILAGYEPKRRVKSPDDVVDVIATLDKYLMIRAQLNIADTIAAAMDGDEGYDPADLSTKLQQMLNDMQQGASNVEDQLVHFGSDDNSDELIDDVLDQDKKPELVPTGFKTFDDVNGGFYLGSLVVIGGSTGGGKSTVGSVQLLKNMSLHAPCALVPLEMTKVEMSYRLVANVSGIDVGKIGQKKLTANEVKKARTSMAAWRKEVEDQDSRYTIFEPDQDMTIEEILYGLQPFGYKVILIDYISLLKGVNGDDSWKQLGEAARFAKMWGKRNNCVVILLAQLSDEGIIRYARAVLEHANNAWFFVATHETRNEGLLHIDQPKARNQNPFSFDLGIDYATMRAYDVDNPPEGVSKGSYDDDDVPPAAKQKSGGKSKSVLGDDDDDVPAGKSGKKSALVDTDDDDEDATPKPKKRPKYVDD